MNTYGCQQYDPARLCRFDRRAIDSRCDGCQRTTDEAYLRSMGLWTAGMSHADTYGIQIEEVEEITIY